MRAVVAVLGAALVLLPAAGAVPGGTTIRVSIAGTQANGDSGVASMSADGRYVVFHSTATNLVAGDTNAATDVFVHDRQAGTTARVSVDSTGAQANSHSSFPEISADGRFVAFSSGATNLVAGDTNARDDVFVRDLQTGTTTRVSVQTGGLQANGNSVAGELSADGRFVSFYSGASDLVGGDTNGATDVFVHDRQGGLTLLVSGAGIVIGNDDSFDPSLSADGRFVAFYSHASNLVPGDTNTFRDVFVYDRATGGTARVSVGAEGAQANEDSVAARLSADGRYVTFQSEASNLVAGDTNNRQDVFVHDRFDGVTTRVSVDSAGTQANESSAGPALGGDGAFAAFSSIASNLVAGDTNGFPDVFVRARETGTTERVSVDGAGAQANGDSSGPRLSTDDRYVVFASNASNLVSADTNAAADVFVHDRQTGETSRVSVASQGAQATGGSSNPAVSGNGRFVGFSSAAANLVSGDTNGVDDIFVHDRHAGSTSRVSVSSGGIQGNGFSFEPSLSADGGDVAFTSGASNLVSGDTNAAQDIFVHDRQTGVTTRVSVDGVGTQANGFSHAPAISADGRFVAFYSDAPNLVAGDTNGVFDVFVHDRQTGATTRISVDSAGGEGNNHSVTPAISADGRFVTFSSTATDLVAGDTNNFDDVFVRDRQLGTTTRVSVATGGAQANCSTFRPAISATGRFVAFEGCASNLVGGDTNGFNDVFVRDVSCGTTTRVSIGSGGTQANEMNFLATVSADGRFVAWMSRASNLVAGDTNGAEDILVRDRHFGTTTRASVDSGGAQGNGASNVPALSGDGGTVAFESDASNLVAGDTNAARDVFVRAQRIQPRRGVPSCGP